MKHFDLFSGIGGFTQAAKNVGIETVIACEKDKFARQVFSVNFPDIPIIEDVGHIKNIELPEFELLTAGFPCQPFSNARKNWHVEPEEHELYGMFWYIYEILQEYLPEYFVLENVIGLRNEPIFQSMLDFLVELGYNINVDMLSSRGYVAQYRNRLFIVGSRSSNIELPKNREKKIPLSSILEENIDTDKYTISDKLLAYATRPDRLKWKTKIYTNLEQETRTLVKTYSKDGTEILITQYGINPRKLTERECARLMGYPDTFIIPTSKTRSYALFGNSIVVPLVEEIYAHILQLGREASFKN